MIKFVVAILWVLAFSHYSKSQNWNFGAYGADIANTKHVPLSEINEQNAHRLEIAWTWQSIDEHLLA